MKIAYISRTETFSAAHRLHSNRLTDAENLEVYGKCNNPHSHGHNYRVTVMVKGPLEEKTDMVVNLKVLKEMMGEILQDLDHKHLDADIDYFKDRASTSENVAIYIWERLEYKLISYTCNLVEVKIRETENNIAIYRGEEIDASDNSPSRM
jgi:6-pyruvoyltetrahydropterin/6-carboxytetrahydropterin synthase